MKLLERIKAFSLAVVAAAVFAGVAGAQTPTVTDKPALLPAKQVLDRYVKAIGGRDNLLKHKTRYQTGTIELSPMGLKGTVESYHRADDRSYTKISIAGLGDLIDGYDGKTSWSTNPLQGSRVREGKELLQTKRLNAYARDVELDKIYESWTVRGTEKVGERNAYVLVGSGGGLPDDVFYFDTETGLLLRTDSTAIAPEGEQAVTTFFDDYREVEGVKSPFKIRAKTPAFEIITNFTELKFGVPIEDAKFVQPK